MWGRIKSFSNPTLSRTWALAPALMLLALCGRSLSGQQAAPLRLGDRVRVVSPDGARTTTGSVVLLTPDSLQVRASAGLAYSIDRDEIGTLERSLCRRCWAATGTLIGAGLGLAGGIFLSQHVNCDEGCLQGTDVLYVSGIGVAAGALLGLAIGAFVSPERWEALPPDRAFGTAEPRPSPTRDGGLALTVRLQV